MVCSCKNSKCPNTFVCAKFGAHQKKFCSTKCRQQFHNYSPPTSSNLAVTTTNDDSSSISKVFGQSALSRGIRPVAGALAASSGLGVVGVVGAGIIADVATPILRKGIKNGAINPVGTIGGSAAGYYLFRNSNPLMKLLGVLFGGIGGNQIEKFVKNEFLLPSLTTTETTTNTTTDTTIISKTQSSDLTVKDVLNSNYPSYNLSNSKLGLIIGNKVSNPFHIAMYGMAGSGKTTIAFMFSQFFASKFGKTKILSSEMGTGDGLKDLLFRSKVNSNRIYIDSNPKSRNIEEHIENLKGYKMLVIDSINHLGWTPEDLELIKNRLPELSTITVLQSVKEGNFKGSNEYAHNADVVLKIDDLEVYTEKTRFAKKNMASIRMF